MTFGNMRENGVFVGPTIWTRQRAFGAGGRAHRQAEPADCGGDGRNRLAAALIDGEDLRDLPLADRKRRLAKLLGRRRLGIVLSEHKAKMRMAPRSSDRPAR
jgi:hypothetical protein